MLTVGKACAKLADGTIISRREFERRQRMERQKRMAANEGEKYDFTYQKGRRIPASTKDPYDFSQ